MLITSVKPRITQKGQVTIPKNIREYLNLKTNTRVEFQFKKGDIVIRPAASLELNFGKIKPKNQPENFKKLREHFERDVAEETIKSNKK